MRRLCVVLLVLVALTGCGGSSGGSDAGTTPSVPSGTPATSDGEVTSTTGLPDDFAFPPEAQLVPVTPHITQYLVKATTVETVKAYWEKYLPSIGFKKYDEASASVFYSKGSVKMQATYAKFNADVEGTVKVLSQ